MIVLLLPVFHVGHQLLVSDWWLSLNLGYIWRAGGGRLAHVAAEAQDIAKWVRHAVVGLLCKEKQREECTHNHT